MAWLSRKYASASIALKVDKIIGKSRPKFDTRNMRTYTPAATKNAENEIAYEWLRKYGGKFAGFRGEVKMRVTVWRCLAKSNPKSWEGRADLGKPDADNILKLVLDALNAKAYHDDSQITDLRCIKMPRIPFIKGNHIHVKVDYFTEEKTRS